MGALTWMSNWYGVSGTPSSQTFLRGDGTFAQVSSASIGTNYTDSVSSGTGINVTGTPGAPWTPVVALTPLTLSATYFSSLSAANLTGVPAGQLTGTITSGVQDLITRAGTLVSGGTGAGFTVALSTSTITGTLAAARLPSVYLGTTAVDLTRASAALSLAGLSVTGAGTWNAGAVTSSGVLTINGFGTHSFSASASGTNRIQLTNATSNATSGAMFRIDTDVAEAALLRAFSSGYTTSGPNVAAGGLLQAAGAGGLSIQVSHASGAIRLYTGGQTKKFEMQSDYGLWIASGVPASTSYALYNNAGTLTWNGVALATGSSVTGTTGTICKFTAANSVGDSIITESGGQITVGGDLIL